MVFDLLLRLPLFLAYLLGGILTLMLAIRRKNVGNVLGFLGFFLLLAVQAVSPITTMFTISLYDRGMPFTRASSIIALASLTLNLVSAVAVLCVVGAIALATRTERRF